MDPCTVEVGLLSKHACGHPSVARCDNCEQALCVKHAIAQHSASGGKTGKFLCAPCNAAAKLYAQTEPAATPVREPGQAPKTAQSAPPKEPPREHSGQFAFTAGTQDPRPPAAAPAPQKPEPPREDSGLLEFTPQPKKPEDKK